jgi:hypothetical protein
MVTLLRVLSVLAALKCIGAVITTSAIHNSGEGVLIWAGRIMDAGTTSFTIAIVTFVVASLDASKNISEKSTN